MKKNKIDSFNNMPTIFKYDSSQQVLKKIIQDEQIIHLQIDFPEKLVENFTGQKNELINKELEHVLKDDDTDLIYFDKELNIFDNNLSNSSFVTNKSDNSMNMSAQTTTSSIKESAKKRPGSSMKKN